MADVKWTVVKQHFNFWRAAPASARGFLSVGKHRGACSLNGRGVRAFSLYYATNDVYVYVPDTYGGRRINYVFELFLYGREKREIRTRG